MNAFLVEYSRHLFLHNLSMLIPNFLSCQAEILCFLVKNEKQNGRQFIRMYTVLRKHLNFGQNLCKCRPIFKILSLTVSKETLYVSL